MARNVRLWWTRRVVATLSGCFAFLMAAPLSGAPLPVESLSSDFVPPAGRGCPPEVRGGPCGKRLLLARSADGLTFVRTYQILTDQADVPDMVVDSRGWVYVYYVGTNVGGENNKLAVAISADQGEHWVFKRVRVDGFEGLSDPVDPDVVILPDGTFRLYVTASQPGVRPRTWVAEGTDGVHFERRGLAFEPPGEALDPSVFWAGETWQIFAGGASTPGRNWHGTSRDGLSFQYAGEVLLEIEGVSQAISNVVAVPGGWRMFTFSHRAPPVIHSFFSADGWHWTAEPGARLGLEENPLESQGVKDAAVARLKDGSWLMVYVTEIPASTTSGPNCWRSSVGLIPLDQLGTNQYRGFVGGLYGRGSNAPPEEHAQGALAAASEVVPRNAAGEPDPAGKIVLLSIGMSNTTQEFSVFQQLAATQPDLNPRLVIVDGAQGGWSADRIVSNGAPFWEEVQRRLAARGVAALQVQVVWLKEADARPVEPFPAHAQRLKEELKAIVLQLAQRFPNLRQVWLSSRIYAGYASTELNPEPYAYESAFAVRWLIEEQMAGAPELDYRGGRVPWLGWGPYLWADGMRLRPDGLIWACSDLGPDGTHPSLNGRQKVARLLLDFFRREPATRSWFLAKPRREVKPRLAAVVHSASYAPQLAPGTIVSAFGENLSLVTASAPALPWPTELGGTRVRVNDDWAPLAFVSPGQVNFLLPPGLAGRVAITIFVEDQASETFETLLQPSAPGLFLLDPTGLAAALDSSSRVIDDSNPARPGDVIQLFGTGFASWHPFLPRPAGLPEVRLAGQPAEVLWFGPSPVYPGLDQINVRVPEQMAGGKRVELRVTWQGQEAVASIPIP